MAIRYLYPVTELLQMLADLRVFLLYGPVADPGIDHGHGQRAMSEKSGDTLQRHSTVDGQSSQGMAKPVR